MDRQTIIALAGPKPRDRKYVTFDVYFEDGQNVCCDLLREAKQAALKENRPYHIVKTWMICTHELRIEDGTAWWEEKHEVLDEELRVDARPRVDNGTDRRGLVTGAGEKSRSEIRPGVDLQETQ